MAPRSKSRFVGHIHIHRWALVFYVYIHTSGNVWKTTLPWKHAYSLLLIHRGSPSCVKAQQLWRSINLSKANLHETRRRFTLACCCEEHGGRMALQRFIATVRKGMALCVMNDEGSLFTIRKRLCRLNAVLELIGAVGTTASCRRRCLFELLRPF
jgi:hypothetical protein